MYSVSALRQDPAQRVPRLSAVRHVRGLPVPSPRTPGQQRLCRQVQLQRVHQGNHFVPQFKHNNITLVMLSVVPEHTTSYERFPTCMLLLFAPTKCTMLFIGKKRYLK